MYNTRALAGRLTGRRDRGGYNGRQGRSWLLGDSERPAVLEQVLADVPQSFGKDVFAERTNARVDAEPKIDPGFAAERDTSLGCAGFMAANAIGCCITCKTCVLPSIRISTHSMKRPKSH